MLDTLCFLHSACMGSICGRDRPKEIWCLRHLDQQIPFACDRRRHLHFLPLLLFPRLAPSQASASFDLENLGISVANDKGQYFKRRDGRVPILIARNA
jgi:hypothetical protein